MWGLQLAVDATDVYWSELDPNEILRMPKSGGGEPAVLVAPEVAAFGGGMAIDDGTLYWSGEGAVFATAADGTTTTLASLSACPADPGVAIAGAVVFAATFACDGNPAELVGVPRAGGEAVRTQLAGEPIRFVAGEDAAQLVIGDELLAIPATGGTGTRLAGIVDGEVLGRDAATIFVNTGNQVLEVPAAGGEPLAIGPVLAARPALIHGDADHLFAIIGGFAHGPASLIAIPRAGGDPQILADDLGDAGALAGDADAVYWTAPDDEADHGGLWRIAKCAAD